MTELEDRIQELTDFVQTEQQSLFRFAWRCIALRGRKPGVQDIEDVMSDAYLTAATLLRDERSAPVRNLGAWFRKILFFRCLRLAAKWRFRQWDRTIDDLEAQDEVLDLVASGVEGSPAHESRLLVRELLDSLDSRSRAIVELAAEGYSAVEIAERVGESPANVRQLKSRAVARLRRDYSRKLG
jgi:RNA polymerase sigma factor (sigma-70 family)